MVKKVGFPSSGELVICKIKNINPNSAFAYLEEYDKEGMVHISEVASGWVRDIRNHIKVGQTVVAKVIRISGDHIYLSLKRVDEKQRNEAIKSFNMNLKSEKMLEIAAGELHKTADDAYKEVGFLLQEHFGDLYNAFKMILKKPERVKELIPAEWFDKLKILAEKNIEQKEFELKAHFIIRSYESDGIKHIKNILNDFDSSGFGVTYISAPKYLVKFRTKDIKKGRKEFNDKLNEIVKKNRNVEASFEIVEKS